MAFALSRNARLFITTVADIFDTDGNIDQTLVNGINANNTWRIPVLDGYSFSQGTTTQDIVVSEAGTSPARGSRSFNTALEPVNWSFSNYLRPRYDDYRSEVDAIERIMWEALTTDPETSDISTTGGAGGAQRNTNSMDVDFSYSNSNTLKTIGLLFDLDGVWYFIANAVVDQAEIDFSLESIASVAWTGFGDSLTDITDEITDSAAWGASGGVASALNDTSLSGDYVAIPTGNLGCIRNKLTTVSLSDNETSGFGTVASLAITGGSLSISNNITFLTPEALGVVNVPCGHFTGARTISGNITAYLRTDTDETGDLLGHLAGSINRAAPFDFDLDMYIGGVQSDTTTAGGFDEAVIHLSMPHTHLVIPTINTEEVLSLDIGFNALPYDESAGAHDLGETNELAISYYAAQ
jgi:hypothetical protein